MAEVRVRIAPSPTGSPHVGTAYIALFNYAFAKKHGGKFILRIEDTDQLRSRPEYESDILDALHWLGLTWDEGPDISGDYGPYRQSERAEIYKKHIDMLLKKDGAYHCFCTPERLAKMREEKMKRKLPLQYDGKCRHLSENAVGKKIKDGEPYVIRLKVPRRGKCTFNDRFRGKIIHEYKQVDDQILLKSDGLPTYHLANVVDDHLMKISHVIRGEEWISSTPKHVLLYDFFEWEKPEFIHMPLLLNPDGSKLSKRKNPTSIFYYKEAGFLPEAILNFLGLMGYSQADGEEKFTLENMVNNFDMSRVSLGGAVFDLQKLKWLSGKYIRENLTPEALYKRLKDWRLNDNFFNHLIPILQQRLDTLGDFIPLCSFLWATDINYPVSALTAIKREPDEIVKVLQTFLFLFDDKPIWDAHYIQEKVVFLSKCWEWKIREITSVLFVAITGKNVAPPLFESMELLGKNLCRVRITNAVEKLGGLSKKKLSKLEKEWQAKLKEMEQEKE